ncbi:MAG: integrase, partial [Mesorhizobium sp.]
ENNLSAALNAYFKENDLFPTPAHKIYSLRHSFEDRMKVGGIDAELRKIIMGHSIDRPDYGVGGTLEWRQENLMRIALPFDPAIV